FFSERSILSIVEKQARSGVCRHINVRPTVVVQVGCYRSQPIASRRTGYAGMCAHISECSITVVVIKTRPRRRKPERTATHRNALPVASGAYSGFGRLC